MGAARGMGDAPGGEVVLVVTVESGQVALGCDAASVRRARLEIGRAHV